MAKRGGKQPGAGRPKGSTTKFRIDDYVSDADFKLILAKAVELAKGGDAKMITWVGDHKLGKAVQPTDMNIVGDMYLSFDPAFNKKKKDGAAQ